MYTIGVMGAASSGKSTLANALAGKMFSKIARRGGTSAPVIHIGGTAKIVDFPSTMSAGEEISAQLRDVDIILYVVDATNYTRNDPVYDRILTYVNGERRAGYYKILVEIACKYDFYDAELDEIIGNPAVRRICALKLLAKVTPSDEEWSVREHAKSGRFCGELTTDESAVMDLLLASNAIADGRKCSILKFIGDFGITRMRDICALLKSTGGENSAIYMQKMAEVMHGYSLATKYFCLRMCGDVLGMTKLEYLKYLPDSHLKCLIYAAENDRVNLAKYLYVSEDVGGVPPEVKCIVPESVPTSFLWGISYLDVCADIGVLDTAEIISSIADEKLRAYFQLSTRSYEELLAEIVAGNSGNLRRCVGDAGVSWKKFRRQLSADYFVHGKRGNISAVVCSAITQ